MESLTVILCLCATVRMVQDFKRLCGPEGHVFREKTQPARCSISQLKKQAYFQPDPMFKRGAVNVNASSLGLEEPPHTGVKNVQLPLGKA